VKRVNSVSRVWMASDPTGKGGDPHGMEAVGRPGRRNGFCENRSPWMGLGGGLVLAKWWGFPTGLCGRARGERPFPMMRESGSVTARPCHQDDDGKGRGRKSSKGSLMDSDRAGWPEGLKRESEMAWAQG
jgi:hypothetical protein